jgi:hypothetical protein
LLESSLAANQYRAGFRLVHNIRGWEQRQTA